jgi:hypothetical protein
MSTGIGEIGGAWLSGSASKKAAQAMANAINRATDEAKRQYDLTTESFAPYTEVGTNAIADYQAMLHGGYDMQESPAAQYQLTQGTKAMNRALASRGLSGSGSAVNRLTELNSSIAATDWSNQYNRLLDAINIGTSASAKTASAGSKYADQLSTAAGQIGNNAWNEAQSRNSIYSNAINGMQNNALNMAALGTKSNWWRGGADVDTSYQGGGGDYGSLANVEYGDYSKMSY